MRYSMRRRSALAGSGALLILAGACSSTPVYSAGQACSLDSGVVEKLLGTNRFTATSEQVADRQLDGSAGPDGARANCSAESDDNRLLIEATVVDAGTAKDNLAVAEAEKTRFEYRGGIGFTRDDAVVWNCGNVTSRIALREDPEEAVDWQEVGQPVWDQLGCLTYSSPGEAAQPDGWS